jgi:hypothetical protein
MPKEIHCSPTSILRMSENFLIIMNTLFWKAVVSDTDSEGVSPGFQKYSNLCLNRIWLLHEHTFLVFAGVSGTARERVLQNIRISLRKKEFDYRTNTRFGMGWHLWFLSRLGVRFQKYSNIYLREVFTTSLITRITHHTNKPCNHVPISSQTWIEHTIISHVVRFFLRLSSHQI